MVLWSAPAAYYAASLAVLSAHSVALLVFLLAVSLAGSILAHATRSSIVRAVFWSAAIVPLFGWIHQHAGSAWLIPGLVTVAAVYALTLLSQFVAVTGDDASWNDADIALLHGNALFTAFAIVSARGRRAQRPCGAGNCGFRRVAGAAHGDPVATGSARRGSRLAPWHSRCSRPRRGCSFTARR